MQSKNTKSKRTVKRRTSPPGCSVILSAERWKVVCEIMEWSLLEWQKQANPKSAKLLVELMGLPLEIRRQVLVPTQNPTGLRCAGLDAHKQDPVVGQSK